MAGNVKGNEDFYRHMDSKRKTMENVRHLLNGAKGLETKDTEKAKMLNAFFVLVFTGEVYLQECQVLDTVGMSGARTTLLQWRRIRLRNILDIQIRWAQAHGTWWDVPTSVVGDDQCHCSATLDCLGKVMAIGRGS